MIDYSNKRLRCPHCGARHGFAPFQGYESLYKGFCHACGVFVPINDKALQLKPEPLKTTFKYINELQVLKSQVNIENDIFAGTLIKLGITRNHLIKFDVGRSGNETFFFYRNISGLIPNAKVISYDKDLCRKKNKPPYFLYSKKQGYTSCLYGEFQLKDNNKPVILVESEKTCILASYAMPQFIWIATGGASSLTSEKAKVLQGRKIFILIDADKAGRSNKLKDQLSKAGIESKTLDLFPNETNGYDLADYLINKMQRIQKAVSELSEYDQEGFNERAAIIEYEGGLSRYNAELNALERIENARCNITTN